jgi:hypothetical protein
LQERGGGVGVLGAQRQADAGVDMQGDAFQVERLGQGVQQPLNRSRSTISSATARSSARLARAFSSWP